MVISLFDLGNQAVKVSARHAPRLGLVIPQEGGVARPACDAAIPSPECSRIHASMPALWTRQAARRFVSVFGVSAVAVESVLTPAASERSGIFLISFVRDAGVTRIPEARQTAWYQF